MTGLGPLPIHAVIAALATLSGWLVVRAWMGELTRASLASALQKRFGVAAGGRDAQPDG
ncbi:hypothetical protein WCE41_08695 [Luteimonas sp. MJ246]|uniref:hypothetical protein n=1 Tax=Luteimonas sp. MJ174 TaxID=3129237 RepID=UPI0031BB1BCE